jgi:hypothetical protein
VLHIVQGYLLSFDFQELGFPGALAEQTGGEIDLGDAGYRVIIQDDLYRKGVVQIDPVRTLFVSVQAGYRNRL